MAKADKIRAVIALGVALACCPCILALDPSLDINQYAHTSWKVSEGFGEGQIHSIAQTSDGYLWLGTDFGLLRFDGVRNVQWQPPGGQHLPSSVIYNLLAARDGTLWIATTKGLASWKSGKLTQYPELTGLDIFALLEDHERTVWVGGVGFPSGRLCAIQNGSVHCYGEDGSLGPGVFSLCEDGRGTLWAGARDGLWRWRPGPPKFFSLAGEPDFIRALGEDADGTLLVEWNGRIRRFVDGKTDTSPLQIPARQFGPRGTFRDRDGGLWIGTKTQGLVHVHQGRTDVFAPSDGLSGVPSALFEDREGSIWVATTNNGLERFRDFAVPTLSVKQGSLNAIVNSVLADRDGSVWLSTQVGLNRWSNGHIMISRTGSARGDGKLDGLAPNCLFQDSSGRIWISTDREFGYLENDHFISVTGLPGGPVHDIAEDSRGDLWIANQNQGLIHLAGNKVVEKIPWTSLGHNDYAVALTADLGALWLGFYNGGVTYLSEGRVRATYTTSDGLGNGHVNSFRIDHDGTLWVATEGGLSRFKNSHFDTLTSKNGLPCDSVHWTMEDDDHSLWLYMPCGLFRVAAPELDTWTAAMDKHKDTTQAIQLTVFDRSDGVRTLSLPGGLPGGYTPRVTKSSDGKIWFLPSDGVIVIDPKHLAINKLPPPVHVEQIVADRKTYWQNLSGDASSSQPKLPPLVRDLEIDYTALSLVVPEKVRFRVKLEGWDRDWQDAGTHRQAFYTNLPPRKYRFRVMACNNSGVWNETGDQLDFSVDPAWFQTNLFRVLCVAAFLLILWALYQLRLRQLAHQFNITLEARVNERTRIARDLHDTLLQSFQALLYRLQSVRRVLPDRPEEASQRLDSAIEQTVQAITEGRDAVHELRSSTVVANDLAQAIGTLGEDLAAQTNNQPAAVFGVQVEGAPRNLHPILRDEVFRIAGEAMRNAFQHAEPKQIEVEIRYDDRQFRMRVRDDGKGIDPKVLTQDGKAGHYGLHGMHERAKLVGGRLDVWSELDSGTEVELSIPGPIAYSHSTGRSGSGRSGTEAETES
jgi:signal transduction histidine kinase/ligand-binding sensor domain-containing protein